MRWKRRYIVAILITFVIVVVYLKQDNTVRTTCNVPNEVQLNLEGMAAVVHKILGSLEVTHFMCYDSLWGSLNSEKQLAWKSELEVCAVNEKALYSDEASLLRTFRKRSLDITYDWNDGLYEVFNATKASGVVKIIIFENDPATKMMRRVGWKRRLLPPDCETNEVLQCFPPRLVDLPLLSKKLGAITLPVPHEEIEIQKYLYPSDWWKDLKPPSC